ncbi:hypothetical protein [Sphingomonas faeni]|uniref:hypothetical protein n=1 Tax=Sphingomonas faeni TaxID=185950 RepID=UPI0033485355
MTSGLAKCHSVVVVLTAATVAVIAAIPSAFADKQVSPVVIKEYVIGPTFQSKACPIRIDGHRPGCLQVKRKGTKAPISPMGLYGWPHEAINGLTCRQSVCLAADAAEIDLYTRSSTAEDIKGLVIVRQRGEVVAVAVSHNIGRNQYWKGLTDDSLDSASRRNAERLLLTYFREGAF